MASGDFCICSCPLWTLLSWGVDLGHCRPPRPHRSSRAGVHTLPITGSGEVRESVAGHGHGHRCDGSCSAPGRVLRVVSTAGAPEAQATLRLLGWRGPHPRGDRWPLSEAAGSPALCTALHPTPGLAPPRLLELRAPLLLQNLTVSSGVSLGLLGEARVLFRRVLGSTPRWPGPGVALLLGAAAEPRPSRAEQPPGSSCLQQAWLTFVKSSAGEAGVGLRSRGPAAPQA